MMKLYDLCLSWNWEYDADFVALLETTGRYHGISLLQATPDSRESIWQGLQQGELAFRALLDRASDADQRFLALVHWAREHGVCRLNRYELAARSWDKAAMHRLLGAALHTPATIILPPYAQQADLAGVGLGSLGDCFSIKPAGGGGGEGVVMGVTSLGQVLAARQERPDDHYLLHSHVVPVELGSRPAWFRVIYCAGQAFPSWWDTQTHVYTPLTPAEEDAYDLGSLRSVVTTVADLCGLDLFSSEVALVADGRFVLVDYVNDPIDLRLQSKTPEGVPDAIVRAIAERLIALVRQVRDESGGLGWGEAGPSPNQGHVEMLE